MLTKTLMLRKSYLVFLIPILVTAGCTSVGPVEERSTALPVAASQEAEAGDVSFVEEPEAQAGIQFSETPDYPMSKGEDRPRSSDSLLSRLSNETVTVNFFEMPVGRFINEVFGNILGLAFEIDDDLSSRSDLVTLRSSDDQSHAELFNIASTVLLNYGVGVKVHDTHLRFVPSQDPNSKQPPLFITGTALPEVPGSHRTVFRFVQLKAVRENVVSTWVTSAFKDTGLIVKSDATSNSIVLQGPMHIVNEAAQTIRLLDRPNMRGRYSVRITPSFVGAGMLAKMLTDVLESEGIGAAQKPPFGSVIILPMLPTNSVIAFAADPAMIEHVKDWAIELDQPVTQNASNDFFYYQVKNTSAAELAEALSGVQQVSEEGESSNAPPGIYVDKNRNGLIFTGEAKGWKAYLPIIKSMDRPARLVNVEVTVASVTLTDDTDLGMEWLFSDTYGDFSGTGQSSFGLGGTGFSYTLNNTGQVRFALNALSQDQRVAILSKPSILVKSGDTASIDVGQEVPIITSQSQSTDTADAPVLQNITYRKTGVLLEVEPTVHSGNRVDLGIKQEVSEVLDSVASAVESPSIFNRKVETTLTLSDGGAVILGGLISTSNNKGSSKIPGLGNIPGLGAFFRSSGNQETRSELILVIQAYIIDIEEKDWDFNEQLKRKLNLLEMENLELN